jgi:hypothetical protein
MAPALQVCACDAVCMGLSHSPACFAHSLSVGCAALRCQPVLRCSGSCIPIVITAVMLHTLLL